MCGRNLELEVFPLTSLNLRGKMVHWFEMKESCQLLEWRDWDLCYTISLLTCKIQRNVRKNETKYSSVAKSKRRLVGQNMGYCLNSSTLQYGLQWQAVEYLEYQEVIDRVPEQIKLFLMFHTSTSPSEGFSLRWVEFRVNWLFHDLTFSQANNKEVTFSLHYEWKDRFCIVSKHIWKFQVVCWFEMNFPSKIANAFVTFESN